MGSQEEGHREPMTLSLDFQRKSPCFDINVKAGAFALELRV